MNSTYAWIRVRVGVARVTLRDQKELSRIIVPGDLFELDLGLR